VIVAHLQRCPAECKDESDGQKNDHHLHFQLFLLRVSMGAPEVIRPGGSISFTPHRHQSA